MSSIVYRYGDALYINLTSRCPTACSFCIKFSWKMWFRGYDLKLQTHEPSVREVLEAVGDPARFREIVFCGYGESTYRLKEMEEIAQALRRHGAKCLRLNTIGLGNLIHQRDIAPDLGRFLDSVSVSLNTADPVQHEKIHRPLPEFRGKTFVSCLEFIRSCVRHVPRTVVTAVRQPDVNVEGVRRLAREMGAEFRVREHLEKRPEPDPASPEAVSYGKNTSPSPLGGEGEIRRGGEGRG